MSIWIPPLHGFLALTLSFKMAIAPFTSPETTTGLDREDTYQAHLTFSPNPLTTIATIPSAEGKANRFHPFSGVGERAGALLAPVQARSHVFDTPIIEEDRGKVALRTRRFSRRRTLPLFRRGGVVGLVVVVIGFIGLMYFKNVLRNRR